MIPDGHCSSAVAYPLRADPAYRFETLSRAPAAGREDIRHAFDERNPGDKSVKRARRKITRRAAAPGIVDDHLRVAGVRRDTPACSVSEGQLSSGTVKLETPDISGAFPEVFRETPPYPPLGGKPVISVYDPHVCGGIPQQLLKLAHRSFSKLVDPHCALYHRRMRQSNTLVFRARACSAALACNGRFLHYPHRVHFSQSQRRNRSRPLCAERLLRPYPVTFNSEKLRPGEVVGSVQRYYPACAESSGAVYCAQLAPAAVLTAGIIGELQCLRNVRFALEIHVQVHRKPRRGLVEPHVYCVSAVRHCGEKLHSGTGAAHLIGVPAAGIQRCYRLRRNVPGTVVKPQLD